MNNYSGCSTKTRLKYKNKKYWNYKKTKVFCINSFTETTLLPLHFNYSNRSISNFDAFGLSVINGGNDCRKTKEIRLIQALSTLSPHGINKHFTFN